MKMKLFTAKDCEKAFPWISAGTTNYRVKIGALPIEHPSPGTGIPNLFRLPELIHAAVLDELASLGVFGVLHKTVIHYHEPAGLNEKGERTFRTWDGSTNAYFVDFNFYEKWDYRVIAGVQLRHDYLPGSNLPRDLRSREVNEKGFLVSEKSRDRYYMVTYGPETFYDEQFIQMELSYWLNPKKEKFNRYQMSKAFIRVRSLYELAKEALDLKD